MKEIEVILHQYRLAIDARDKLTENYHKWMTYYYVAIGAILVAFTAFYEADNQGSSILLLSLAGLLISIYWNLSCKGYYYWSLSWMKIIINYEHQIRRKYPHALIGVFSVFSKEVSEKEDAVYNPVKPANISTPKVTLLFTYSAILAWLAISIFQIYDKYYGDALELFICASLLLVITTFLLYFCILPKILISRDKRNKHDLI